MNASMAPNPMAKPVQHTPIVAHKPVLKILGLGGGGSNAVNRLIELGLDDVEFIVANTDIQALNQSLAPKKIQLGPRLTRGLGAGGNPKMGEAAAEESYRELAAALAGAETPRRQRAGAYHLRPGRRAGAAGRAFARG